MNIFKNFKKNKKVEVDSSVAKNFNLPLSDNNCRVVDSIKFQQSNGLFAPTFRLYFYFYQAIGPLGDAVDLIADQFSSIEPKIFDTKNKEFVEDHPFLDLLKNPIFNQSYCEMAKQEASFFELTGNIFWILNISRLGNEPLGLQVISPELITVQVGSDGRPSSYSYFLPNGGSEITFRRFLDKRSVRYLSADKRIELFQLKRFNPNAYASHIFGLSKLHSIFYDLAQYQAASIHNQSLLQNGARPSGMLIPEKDLTPDQLQYMRSEFETVFSGVANAGRPLMPTGKMTWTDFTMSNRDMDFSTLKIQLKENIYNRLKIPLPLVNSNALSLANMEVAMLQLYQMAVLPITTDIYTSLTKHVLSKYPNSENLILSFDTFSIPSLRDKNIDQILKLSQLNVLSDNEIRDKIDLNSYEGGDEIYKPSSFIPVADVSNTQVENDQS